MWILWSGYSESLVVLQRPPLMSWEMWQWVCESSDGL